MKAVGRPELGELGPLLAIAGSPGKAGRTRARLIEMTREEILQTGDFGAERVAHRAGLAPATFWTYFPSRDDALAGAFDLVLAEQASVAAAALRIERLLEIGLHAVLSELIESLIDTHKSYHLVYRLALARMAGEGVIRDVWVFHRAQAREIRLGFLRLGAAAGKIQIEEPQDTVDGVFEVLLDGLNATRLVHDRDGGRVVAHVIDMLAGFLEAVPRRPR